MRLLVATAIIGVLAFIVLSVGPWWLGALIGLFVALALRLKPGPAFVAGFLGLFLAWSLAAGWTDFQNHSVLSARIGQLLGGLPSLAVVLISGVVGGLAGAFCTMTGGLLSSQLTKRASAK